MTEQILCQVCKGFYPDDNEFICKSCCEKWRTALIIKGEKQGKLSILNEIIKKWEDVKGEFEDSICYTPDELLEMFEELKSEVEKNV
jgi:hypothetical protein